MTYGVNAPNGLVFANSNSGAISTAQMTVFKIASNTLGTLTFNTSIGINTPVVWNATIAVQGVNSGAGTIAPYVAAADAGQKILGTFQYCVYTDIQGNRLTHPYGYWPAGQQVMPNTIIEAYVCTDPNVLYSVQVSTSTRDYQSGLWSSDMMGLNAELKFGGTPIDTNIPAGVVITQNPTAPIRLPDGTSTYYLDASTAAVTATLPFKVLGFDNTLSRNNAILSPIDPTTGIVTPNDPTNTQGGFFINVIGTLNTQNFKSVGTLGVQAA